MKCTDRVVYLASVIVLAICVLISCSEDDPPTKPGIDNEPIEESVTQTITSLDGGTEVDPMCWTVFLDS